MRFPLALAAAPLALLAACGGNTDTAEDAAAAPGAEAQAGAAGATAAAGGAAGEAGSAAAAGSASGGTAAAGYAGSYTFEEGGRTTRLTLRDDDSFEYVPAAGGEPRTGRYTRLDEGRRILIEDYDGRAAYFTVSDGELYRLASETATPDEITVTSRYRRELAPVQEAGPSATTDSVADKRR